MVQSRDQRLESSGTALAEVYHNFVQTRALESKILPEIKFTKIKTLHRTTGNSKDIISIEKYLLNSQLLKTSMLLNF